MLRPACLPSNFAAHRAANSAAEPASDSYLSDLATIFATAILRLNARRRLPEKISPKLSESTGECLEFSTVSRLNGPCG